MILNYFEFFPGKVIQRTLLIINNVDDVRKGRLRWSKR